MKSDEMTVDQFKEYLAKQREQLMNMKANPNENSGRNMRGMINKTTARIMMQRGKTQYRTKP